MQLSIPSSWGAVTPAWMTAALADAFPGVEVFADLDGAAAINQLTSTGAA
jgi:hypothetical protein